MFENNFRHAVAASLLTLVVPASSALADEPTAELTIRDHRFHPEMLTVRAGVRIRLVIENTDPTPEEFESQDLNREKVIPGKSRATLFIGPLDPGIYPFVGEFHEKTAKGSIVAK